MHAEQVQSRQLLRAGNGQITQHQRREAARKRGIEALAVVTVEQQQPWLQHELDMRAQCALQALAAAIFGARAVLWRKGRSLLKTLREPRNVPSLDCIAQRVSSARAAGVCRFRRAQGSPACRVERDGALQAGTGLRDEGFL